MQSPVLVVPESLLNLAPGVHHDSAVYTLQTWSSMAVEMLAILPRVSLGGAPGQNGRMGCNAQNVRRGFGQNPIAQVRTRYSGHHFSRLARDASKRRQRKRSAYLMRES